MIEPVFILAPGRSFTSVVCAMLGQHPQMYGLPELNLSVATTLREWWVRFQGPRTFLSHGLLRVVAELFFGDQNVATIVQARRWVRCRLFMHTGSVLELLAEAVHPLGFVEKSPIAVSEPRYLERLGQSYPRARFIHLLRHPRSNCESMLSAQWSCALVAYANGPDGHTSTRMLDPQMIWYKFHTNIREFLKGLPKSRQLRIRGEDLLAEPDPHLRLIAEWLGLRADSAAIEEMKHPERSPFACLGPPGARFGNDPTFLKSPALRPHVYSRRLEERESPQGLEGPLRWRADGAGFRSEVKRLAETFGYS